MTNDDWNHFTIWGYFPLRERTLTRIKRRRQTSDRRHSIATALLLFLAGVALSPLFIGSATAHSTATSCTHSKVGILHTQTFTVGSYSGGYHWHTVQLGHPFDSTPEYDGVRHNHATGGCTT